MFSLHPPLLYFEAPLLGPSSCRLRVLWSKPDLFALEKPPRLLACSSPFFPSGPSLEKALEAKFGPKGPSQGSFHLRSIFPLDSDCSGCALISTNPALTEHYRNAYGSYQFTFVFQLLVQANTLDDSLDCDFPLFHEPHTPLGFISHKQGKKAHTRFQRLERLSPHYELWEAHASYIRPYQIHLHAKACGLKIVGESLVDSIPCVSLSELKRGRYKGLEKPLYPNLALHLASLRMNEEEAFAIPLPKPFEVMLSKIRQHS